MIIIDEMAIMIDCKLDRDLHFVDFIFTITANEIINLLTIKSSVLVVFRSQFECDFYSLQIG